jgi:hypothetical protein
MTFLHDIGNLKDNNTDSSSKVRGDPIAKPQAVCRTHWTIDALNMGKIGAVLNWNPNNMPIARQYS